MTSSSNYDDDDFLVNFLRTTPSAARNETSHDDDGGGGGGHLAATRRTVDTEAADGDPVWTPEVIFRVSTITVVMAVTLVGNVALICVISCHPSLRRKRVSVFLLNLAVGDLMVCLVTMTTEILFVAFGQWVLGSIACKIIVYGQIVTLASTTFLLTAMSIDRYQSLRGAPHVWPKMVFSWVLALIFATPQLFIFVEVQEQGSASTGGRKVAYCKSAGYTEEWQRKVYFSFMTAYILVIPTAVMSFCYFSIIQVVWMRSGGKDIDTPKIHFITSRRSQVNAVSSAEAAEVGAVASGPVDAVRGSLLTLSAAAAAAATATAKQRPSHVSIPQKMALLSKRNVIKMTLSVIVGFVFCWTPYFAVSLVRIFSSYRIKLVHALNVSEILALVHSALNPILYMAFSAGALRALCWNFRCRRLCDSRRRRARRKRKQQRLSPEDTSTATEANPLRGVRPVAAADAAAAAAAGGRRQSRGQPLSDSPARGVLSVYRFHGNPSGSNGSQKKTTEREAGRGEGGGGGEGRLASVTAGRRLKRPNSETRETINGPSRISYTLHRNRTFFSSF